MTGLGDAVYKDSWLTGNSCTDQMNKPTLSIDYTPNYWGICPDCPDRVKNFYGAEWSKQLKLMVIFRNPTDRVRSWFSHFQAAQDINPWVLEGLESIKKSEDGCEDPSVFENEGAAQTICNSVYAIAFSRWIELFAPEQLLVLSFTNFIEKPGETLKAIGEHMGLTPNVEYSSITQAAHANTADHHLEHAPEGFNDEMNDEVTALLDEFFEPYNIQLKALFLTSGVKYMPSDDAKNPVIY